MLFLVAEVRQLELEKKPKNFILNIGKAAEWQ